MTVVTFIDYEPPPRYDGNPWTKITIDEASAEDGPWTLIDTITFAVPDADPAHPQARSFTTENATLDNGWYQVTFIDLTGDEAQPTAPVQNIAAPFPAGIVPTLAEVGALERARTKDTMGNELGTFTSDTRPTDDQAKELIIQAAYDVTASVGHDPPDTQLGYIKQLVIVHTAMLIELSYFPEQVANNRSPYAQYQTMYNDKLASVLKSIQASEAGDEGVPSANYPAYYFPPPTNWMEGRM